MLRKVEPEEMAAIAQLAAENPDLRAVVVELGQLRALRAATGGAAPLRPSSVRELLQLVKEDVLEPDEARPYLGLEPRRGTLATLQAAAATLLQVVVLGLARPFRLAGARS